MPRARGTAREKSKARATAERTLTRSSGEGRVANRCHRGCFAVAAISRLDLGMVEQHHRPRENAHLRRIERVLDTRKQAFFIFRVTLDQAPELSHCASELFAVDGRIEDSLERLHRAGKAKPGRLHAVFVKRSAGRRIEHPRFHGHMGDEIARQLRKQRRTDARAAVLYGLAELLEIAVLAFEQRGGFHRLPESGCLFALPVPKVDWKKRAIS